MTGGSDAAGGRPGSGAGDGVGARGRAPARATILHVDLDAFFAAVEQRDRPELRGKPVIVGGGGPDDRGVVSTASYEARRYGVRSAMPLRTAGRLCPEGVFLPVDGAKYQAESRRVMTILRRFTSRVEQVSIDEAFLDVAGSEALFGPPEEIARRIKSSIHDETGLTASVGVATSKLVAKIGSDLRKPDGLVVVPAGEEAAFLAPLPVSRLWGVGPATATALAELGVRTIGDLARTPPDALERRLGKHGVELIDRAHGIDRDPVHEPDALKSVGHEHTFDRDTSDQEEIERTLLGLADGVAWRLRGMGRRAGTVVVKVRDSAFRTVTRQAPLPEPTDLAEPIFQAALRLARPEMRGKRIRLLGVTGTHLDEPDQLGMFSVEDDRRHRAMEAADALRRRYGDRTIVRARLLDRGLPAPFERDPSSPLARRGVDESSDEPERVTFERDPDADPGGDDDR
ncbi:MAG: DNA polymerase IV [Chloroflexi bacterium]|nr:DNA polymerase IV [Chloroflexota bacterium]